MGKSLTVSTKKFDNIELNILGSMIQNALEERVEMNDLFNKFVKNPEDPKWMNSKIPQEYVVVVRMIKEMNGANYDELIKEFINSEMEEERQEVEDLSRILIKLDMRR